ncbi:MAG: glycosyltransferase family 39 protein [Gallionellaceae bacterium]|nr:glycosyltransferase family 39 protein [Gallionellaceae bacterium]
MTVSAQSLGGVFHDMLRDVHPPLYQVLLWAWMGLFGDSEPATRSLSLVFAVAALAHVVVWSKKLHPETRLALLIFFCTTALLPNYAQETRSYAMVLFLSTLLTTGLLDYDGSRRRFIGLVTVCALLSLTHYFGLLLSLAALGWLLFRDRRDHARVLTIFAVLALAAAWPASQFLLGDIADKTGGQFWIKVDGPIDTIMTAIRAPTNLTGFFIVFALIAALSRNLKAEWLAEKSHLARAGFLLAATILLALLIDLHTPISTKRNFIVLLPAYSVLFGIFVGGLLRHPKARLYAYVVLALFALDNAHQAYKHMHKRWMPLQDWRATAALISRDHTPGTALYFIPLHDAKRIGRERDDIFNYYLNRQSYGRLRLAPINIAEIGAAPRPFLILFSENNNNFIEDRLRKQGLADAVTIRYPTQQILHGAGVIESLDD